METKITRQISWKNDRGLTLLLPLYNFLRNTCVEAAFHILVQDFKNAHYVKENINKHIFPKMRLLDLLCQIHSKTKSNGKVCKKKGKGGCAANTLQGNQNPQIRRQKQICNIKDNENVLSQVTVEDLLNADYKQCDVLRGLDLIFMFNVITNEIISYTLSDYVLEAMYKIKDIRNTLYHPRFSFSKNDFESNLRDLVKAVHVLHLYLGYPLEELRIKEAHCREEALAADLLPPRILAELRSEIYKKYTARSNYIAPNISLVMEMSEPVVEDLVKYVCDQKYYKHGEKLPVLLCGNRGTGKSGMLQNLAFSMSQVHNIEASGFSLVLYLDEWSRRNWAQQCTLARDAGEEFWEQVFRCIISLAPDTVVKYSLGSIKTIIKIYRDEILFLIDWDINVGPIRKEMQRGTWVVAHHGPHAPSVDWQILRVDPYEEVQVEQILKGLRIKHWEDVVRLYENFEYKSILTSLDMIKIFSEMNGCVTTGTDFEIAEAYVSKQFDSLMYGNKELLMIALGETVFHPLCRNRSVFRDSDLCNVPSEVKDKFFVQHGKSGSTFIHGIAQDFLASRYVISQPNKACKEWLGNVNALKRVFRFACFSWCKDSIQLRENLHYIKDYLMNLFGIEGKSWEYNPNKNNKQELEPMEVDGSSKKKRNAKNKCPQFVNPLKDPFTKWGFIVNLDDACHGRREILELLAHLLSQIPCWVFKLNTHLDDGKLRRIEKILTKVKLKKDCPLTIKLESIGDTLILLKIWNKLRNIESLHECAHVKITIKCNKNVPLGQQSSVAELLTMIASSHSPLYITQYTGPFFCSEIPDFLKCLSMRRLERIDVSVHDVASLSEVMSCKGLSFLKDVTVRVDLRKAEQSSLKFPSTEKPEQACLQPCNIEIPKHVNLNLTVIYFTNIQDLLNRFKSPHHLMSLSIHDLFVEEDFRLDLSSFKDLESLNIRCEPDREEEINVNAMDQSEPDARKGIIDNIMEVNQAVTAQPISKKLPRHNWMFALVMNLILPARLERLLLRNMEFFNSSNNYMMLNFFRKHNIDRLVILDSLLSLKGARQVLSTHTGSNNDDLEAMTKRLRVDESGPFKVRDLVAKQPRLSREERENRRKKKPKGKEVIITSELSLCTECKSFPCLCPPQVGVDNKDTFEDLIHLIEDIYSFDVLSFTYTSNILTVRKDLCGDLRVQCSITELNDDVACGIDSSCTWISELFKTLTLAQCISLDYTDLSDKGAMAIVSHLKKVKGNQSKDKKVECFSLTIGSICHPESDEVISGTFIEFIKKEDCLAMFNFWCMCKDKCFKLKKAHSGQILVNDKLI